MKRIAGPCLGLLLLTGCASVGTADLTGAHPSTPPETFMYKVASNGHVRVEVDGVALHTDKDFIPTDPNWLQVRVRITNVGTRTVSLSGGGEQLANGRVVHDAQSGSDIIKPPSVGKTVLMQSGGLAAGLLFPPALMVGIAADVALPLMTISKTQRAAERANAESLRAGPIAPGTSVEGLMFVPAVHGQAGLVLYYDEGGTTESIAIPRAQS